MADKKRIASYFLLITIAALTTILLSYERDWLVAVLLISAMVLIHSGIRQGRLWLRLTGLGAIAISAPLYFIRRSNFPEPFIPLLNYYSITMALGVMAFFYVAHVFYHNPVISEKEKNTVWPAAAAGTLLAMVQISREVANGVIYYQLDLPVKLATSLAWGLFALFLLALSLVRGIRGFRYISSAVLCLAFVRIVFFYL